ncbi:MAG: hypothetical protein ACRC8A_14055 [Microcoleaceae cyanobacterium]
MSGKVIEGSACGFQAVQIKGLDEKIQDTSAYHDFSPKLSSYTEVDQGSYKADDVAYNRAQKQSAQIHLPKRAMKKPIRGLLSMLIVLGMLFFVLSGDSWSFLPQSARNVSVKTREFFGSFWPSWLQPKDTNEQREEELKQLGQ